jgi:hypothetical protein
MTRPVGPQEPTVASLGDTTELEDAWHRHRSDQVARWASRTPAERLDWLWQAKQFASRALGAARSPSLSTPPPAPAERVDEASAREQPVVEEP